MIRKVKLMPGESAFSHLTRTTRSFGYSDVNNCSRMAFPGANSHFSKGLVIPSGRRFLEEMNANKSLFEYIKKTTDFPLLAKLSGRRKKPINLTDADRELKLLNFITGQAIPIETVGACRKCADEQISEEGYSWWLMEHAISGMTCCVKHGLLLQNFCFRKIVDGFGILPIEILSNTSIEVDQNSYQSRFSNGIHKALNSEFSLVPKTLFVVAISKIKTDNNISASEAKKIFDIEFLNEFLRPYDELMRSRGRVNCHSKWYVAGEGWNWKGAIEIALKFFDTFEKMEQAFQEFNPKMIDVLFRHAAYRETPDYIPRRLTTSEKFRNSLNLL